ncbi:MULTISPECIES: helix-turn-helix transcriptional regulator [Burkholderia]|uniref:helix-turn-helix transcriptional regulator n=1 Tax=Burkholderia TaxID=32008 RepID=UPI0013F4CB29|nr:MULTISPECIES: AraC family transcriptional regulator [Burkholderia]
MKPTLLLRPTQEACQGVFHMRRGDLATEVHDSALVTPDGLLPCGMVLSSITLAQPPSLPFHGDPRNIASLAVNVGRTFRAQVRLAGVWHDSLAEPGAVLAVPPGCDTYSVYQPGGGALDTLHLACPPEHLERIACESGLRWPTDGLPAIATGQADPQMVLLGRALLLEMDQGTPLLLETLTHALAIHLLRALDGGTFTPPRTSKGLAPHVARRVAEHIQQHLEEPLKLSELADVAGLSVHHFCRMFRQTFGQPPHRYLTRERIGLARTWLLNKPEWSIGDIAHRLGFGSPSHFSQAFRTLMHCTPQDYRQQHEVSVPTDL